MKQLTISSKDISPKQWNILLIELNIIKKAWAPYAKLDIKAPNFNKIIKWGTRRYDAKENGGSCKPLGENQRPKIQRALV